MSAEPSYNSSLEHLYDELDWLDLHIELSVQSRSTGAPDRQRVVHFGSGR